MPNQIDIGKYKKYLDYKSSYSVEFPTNADNISEDFFVLIISSVYFEFNFSSNY